MDTKSLRVEVKDAAKGQVEAVFATYNVVDSDGDVTVPDAFEDGAEVRISAYGHESWRGRLPVGKGVIKTTDTDARLVGQFFLNTTAGRETFEVVKQMGGLQEWSYGYDIVTAEPGVHEGQQVQVLKALTVHEVSPVLLGAGVATRTVSAKASKTAEEPAGQRAVKRAIGAHDTEVVARSWDGPGTVAALPADARPSQLRTVYAWVDPDGDPEAKSSYKFPHHHGVDGPANARACMAGIAVLNGARGGSGIPDADRKGIYNHLASHLKDADREVPELRSRGDGAMKFNDELLEGLAGVSSLIDSASRVVALRAEKGKSLSKVNAELLDWIADDLKRLRTLLTTPHEGTVSDEELASTFLASVAQLNNP